MSYATDSTNEREEKIINNESMIGLRTTLSPSLSPFLTLSLSLSRSLICESNLILQPFQNDLGCCFKRRHPSIQRGSVGGVGPGGVTTDTPGVWGAPRSTQITLPGPLGLGPEIREAPLRPGPP